MHLTNQQLLVKTSDVHRDVIFIYLYNKDFFLKKKRQKSSQRRMITILNQIHFPTVNLWKNNIIFIVWVSDYLILKGNHKSKTKLLYRQDNQSNSDSFWCISWAALAGHMQLHQLCSMRSRAEVKNKSNAKEYSSRKLTSMVLSYDFALLWQV